MCDFDVSLMFLGFFFPDGSTSEVVCPGLVTPGWNWGLLTGTGRRGAGLLRTTVLETGEAEVTGAEACWGS